MRELRSGTGDHVLVDSMRQVAVETELRAIIAAPASNIFEFWLMFVVEHSLQINKKSYILAFLVAERVIVIVLTRLIIIIFILIISYD